MVKNSASFESLPEKRTGTLYVVAMPIGNRDDITLRARTTLQSVDAILAEDTRHSLPLLNSLNIQKPLISFHAHNENQKNQTILDALVQGKSFALISDAGTPLISDPGFSLVRLARENNITVTPIPGACALITALSGAGIPCSTFTFIGFLPAKTTLRKERLTALKSEPHTLVLYESCHRIVDCIETILEVHGNSYEFVLAKELTKLHERFIKGAGQEILAWLNEDVHHVKGEFVLILPPPETAEEDTVKEEEVLKILLSELPLKKAVSVACRLTKGSRNLLYQLALRISKTTD